MNNNNNEPYIIPGFHFAPKDREVILHYVAKRNNGEPLPWNGIGEFDIYGEAGPWELVTSDKPEYVFATSKSKTENSMMRKKRTCSCGTWKFQYSVPIYDYDGVTKIGLNSQLSFKLDKGKKPPHGMVGLWRMHEYSLLSSEPDKKYPYVVCKVSFKSLIRKKSSIKRKSETSLSVPMQVQVEDDERVEQQPVTVSYPDYYNQDPKPDQAGPTFTSACYNAETKPEDGSVVTNNFISEIAAVSYGNHRVETDQGLLNCNSGIDTTTATAALIFNDDNFEFGADVNSNVTTGIEETSGGVSHGKTEIDNGVNSISNSIHLETAIASFADDVNELYADSNFLNLICNSNDGSYLNFYSDVATFNCPDSTAYYSYSNMETSVASTAAQNFPCFTGIFDTAISDGYIQETCTPTPYRNIGIAVDPFIKGDVVGDAASYHCNNGGTEITTPSLQTTPAITNDGAHRQ